MVSVGAAYLRAPALKRFIARHWALLDPVITRQQHGALGAISEAVKLVARRLSRAAVEHPVALETSASARVVPSAGYPRTNSSTAGRLHSCPSGQRRFKFLQLEGPSHATGHSVTSSSHTSTWELSAPSVVKNLSGKHAEFPEQPWLSSQSPSRFASAHEKSPPQVTREIMTQSRVQGIGVRRGSLSSHPDTYSVHRTPLGTARPRHHTPAARRSRRHL